MDCLTNFAPRSTRFAGRDLRRASTLQLCRRWQDMDHLTLNTAMLRRMCFSMANLGMHGGVYMVYSKAFTGTDGRKSRLKRRYCCILRRSWPRYLKSQGMVHPTLTLTPSQCPSRMQLSVQSSRERSWSLHSVDGSSISPYPCGLAMFSLWLRVRCLSYFSVVKMRLLVLTYSVIPFHPPLGLYPTSPSSSATSPASRPVRILVSKSLPRT